MPGWGSALAAAAACLAASAAPASAATAGVDQVVPHHRVCAFTDDRVVESSGLVDRGSRLFTINDSRDGPYVYGVDPVTCDTVSRTTYSSGGVEDVEAIAPAAHGTVWVGDIGDNQAGRADISVYRVRPADSGDVTVSGQRFRLTYPDGPHDAETLLVQPRSQRIFVVSKSVFGGRVYVAPRTLHADRENRLRTFAAVDGLVTDGTFFPDGRHVLLRTYGTASVYTFPDFRLVGTVRLPEQRQGEGISIGPGGRVLLSSEGLHAPVLQVTLPAWLTHPRPAGQAPSGPRGHTPKPQAVPQGGDRAPGSWLAVGAAALGLAGLGVLAARLSRVRRRAR